MKRPFANSVNIFLTADKLISNSYFNTPDLAPIYIRQLNHQFEAYIMVSVKLSKRYSALFYKLKCSGDDKKLMTAGKSLSKTLVEE